MTLTNFIRDQNGDLINTDHIVKIIGRCHRASCCHYEYAVVAVLDTEKNNEHTLFSVSEESAEDYYEPEVASEYCSKLWNGILDNIETITDIGKYERDFERRWNEEHNITEK